MRPQCVQAAGSAFLAVLFRANVAQAQIYTLLDEPAPGNKSLHTLYAFYVYSHEEAPEKSLGSPFVKFQNIKAVPADGNSDLSLKSYMGLQLGILKFAKFWDLINPQKFCCDSVDVQNGDCPVMDQLLMQRNPEVDGDIDAYMHTAPFANADAKFSKDDKMIVRRTGVYILVLSNCGELQVGTLTGSVIVKNAYGFLPGIEYHKLPFYGWLLLFYGGLGLAWMLLSLRWWRELINIQNCVAIVILLGLFESFLWWIFFNDWNSSGLRGRFLFVMAILFSVVKSTFSYMLVLVASMGWGVTRPFLDPQALMKIKAISTMYIILGFLRETALSFRHSHSLSLGFVVVCLLPVSLLNGGIFYWIFSALSNLIETLKERQQQEKLSIFQTLWWVLVTSLGFAGLMMVFQIMDVSSSITTTWKYQWLFSDGVSHILFAFVLVVMMYLWAPHKYSQRYAYTHMENKDKESVEAVDSVWADEAAEEEHNDDESFWSATRGDTAFPEDPEAPLQKKPKAETTDMN
mmetsp:Transcript_28818/g.79426  ORF Transcript_28818/g.79426 Transcript_28818/m.79426 type:complete len:517 (-) Transcript_28818:207-1757(-)